MVGRAESALLKHFRKIKTTDSKIKSAANDYKSINTSAKTGSYRAVARKYGAAKETVRRRVKGGRSMLQRGVEERATRPEEDEELALWIEGLSDRALPPTNAKIIAMANRIVASRGGHPVGKNWIYKFKGRQAARLATSWGSSYSTQKASALNPTNLKEHFAVVSSVYESFDVKDHNRFVADETGLQKSQNGAVRVVGRRGVKRQHVQQNSDRVLTSVMGTICADGTSLPPFVIFKGERFQASWGANNRGGALCVLFLDFNSIIVLRCTLVLGTQPRVI